MSWPLYEIAVITPFTANVQDKLTVEDVCQGRMPQATYATNYLNLPGVYTKNTPNYLSFSRPYEVAESVTGYSVESVSSWTRSTDTVFTDSSVSEFKSCQSHVSYKDNEGPELRFIQVPRQNNTNCIPSNCSDAQSSGTESLQTPVNLDIETMLMKVAGDICALVQVPDSNDIPQQTFETNTHDAELFNEAVRFNTVGYPPLNNLSFEKPELSGFSVLSKSGESYLSAMSVCRDSDASSSAFSSCRVSRASSQCDLHELGNPEENFADVESAEYDSLAPKLKVKPKLRNRKPMATMFTPPQTRDDSGASKVKTDLPRLKLVETDEQSGFESGSRASSGYCDSPTLSSACSEHEFSYLNPLCKPFVPRSNLSQEYLSSGLSSSESVGSREIWNFTHLVQPSTENLARLPGNSAVFDSGIEQTNLWNTTHASTHSSSLQQTFDEAAMPETVFEPKGSHCVIPDIVIQPHSDFKDTSDLCPYRCKLVHKGDFTPIDQLKKESLPKDFQTTKHLDQVVTISQRVVKLRLRKSFAFEPLEPEFSLCNSCTDSSTHTENSGYEHFGTGFACNVNEHYIEIRTHYKMVGSPEEAEKTEVTFSLAFPDGGKCVQILCQGQREGFHRPAHSHVTVFTCLTPRSLLPFLHLFTQVPSRCRSSLFNDSCYFSDSSLDSSTSETSTPSAPKNGAENNATDLHSKDGAKHSSYAEVVGNARHENKFSFADSRLPNLTEISREFHDDTIHGGIRTPTTSFTGGRVASPLAIIERRLKDKEKIGCCPYSDEATFGTNGLYTHFSSYAGDVLSQTELFTKPLLRVATPLSNPSPLESSWEYEALIYAQSFHRDAYNRLHKPATNVNRSSSLSSWSNSNQWDDQLLSGDTGLGQTLVSDQVNAHYWNLLNENNSFYSTGDSYLKTWDKDLINVDENLYPLAEFNHFEKMVNDILDEGESQKTCCRKSYTENQPRHRRNSFGNSHSNNTHSIIISHPHGGRKVISCGSFSSHFHIGGDLYDTPTCMGCCGAPVLTFSGEDVYVTHLVHAGTTKVYGVTSGMGVSFFYSNY
ncbi:uncharacterized protein LOC131948437 [Physella acuta]|uniref:uncharacterized protein LOC131948437 n=1 Tax=Physella acuta TaxID=109671 RepID=UPI0027DC760A|nr:uncharacterized protein LOC131948437 [Physella acuta]